MRRVSDFRSSPLRRRVACLIATGFGAGYMPRLPGTVGSGIGLLLFLPLRHTPALFYGLFVVALFVLGLWAAGEHELVLNQRDPACIVIDEIHAMLWLLPVLPSRLDTRWVGWGAAFCLFRLFDVMKPPPIRRMERLPGGWGIMLDDLVAAGYAWAILWAIHLVQPEWVR